MSGNTAGQAIDAMADAFEALRASPKVVEATMDNDHKSAEIIFTTKNGAQWILKLESFEE